VEIRQKEEPEDGSHRWVRPFLIFFEEGTFLYTRIFRKAEVVALTRTVLMVKHCLGDCMG